MRWIVSKDIAYIFDLLLTVSETKTFKCKENNSYKGIIWRPNRFVDRVYKNNNTITPVLDIGEYGDEQR